MKIKRRWAQRSPLTVVRGFKKHIPEFGLQKITMNTLEVSVDGIHTDIYYHDYACDRGWKAMILKKPKRRKSFTAKLT